MRTLKLLLTLTVALTVPVFAQNPIISTIFTPDPAPFVYGDKVYLFTDHDEDGHNADFNMKDWLLFSTEDMVNWTYLGTQVTTATFSWARQGQRAWASQGVERDGKWYWYVCCNIATGGDALAVAVADDPQGPWRDAIGKPLTEGFGFIDPTVFIDDDGRAYLFWGNKGLWYGELNDDMVSFKDGWKEVPGYRDPKSFGELQSKMNWARGRNEMMTQFEEGPWLMKRNGIYYLSYPAGGVPEHMAYSTAPTVHGPWTYRGRIMDEAENSFTIHGGNITFKGRDFMFYHNGMLPGGGGFNRSACVEEFKFNEDGSIPFIPFTKEGVVTPIKNLDPYKRVEAETMAEARGLKNDRLAGKDHYVTDIHDGDWMRVRSVDFKDCGQKLVTVVVGRQRGKGTIEFHIDNMEGEPFCTVPVNTDNAGFPTASFSYLIDTNVTGVHDLYIVFRCETPEPFTFDWWQFNSHANLPIIQTSFTADPAPVVINDTVFLYTTHDEDGARGFQMFDWLLYTSDDMVNWQDHGAVASLDDFKYYDGKNGAWAQEVVEANGAYYMYCPIHGLGGTLLQHHRTAAKIMDFLSCSIRFIHFFVIVQIITGGCGRALSKDRLSALVVHTVAYFVKPVTLPNTKINFVVGFACAIFARRWN
jgi:arabinoxylan arabinofuranohydrolase